MAISNIVGYFLATLAPTYATPPTTGGCVVFISGYTASTLNSTVTDTFGPIIVPAGGCVFTGMTTNELKRLHAVAIRPGYNNVTGFYITGETINPSLRKVAATTINLLTGAATETSSSKKCPTYEDVGEYASKAGATVSLTSSQALRCYPKTYYPLFGSTMYTTTVYTNQVPVYSKLYYGCSSNVLSGCSSNCKLDRVICAGDEVICVSDGDTCLECSETTINTGKTGTISITFNTKIDANFISVTGYSDSENIITTINGNGWESVMKNGAEYLAITTATSTSNYFSLALVTGVMGPYACKYHGITKFRFSASYGSSTTYISTTGFSDYIYVDGTTTQSIYVTVSTSGFTIS